MSNQPWQTEHDLTHNFRSGYYSIFWGHIMHAMCGRRLLLLSENDCFHLQKEQLVWNLCHFVIPHLLINVPDSKKYQSKAFHKTQQVLCNPSKPNSSVCVMYCVLWYRQAAGVLFLLNLHLFKSIYFYRHYYPTWFTARVRSRLYQYDP